MARVRGQLNAPTHAREHRTAGWFPRRAVTPFWLHQHLITAFLCSFSLVIFSVNTSSSLSLFSSQFLFFLLIKSPPPGIVDFINGVLSTSVDSSRP